MPNFGPFLAQKRSNWPTFDYYLTIFDYIWLYLTILDHIWLYFLKVKKLIFGLKMTKCRPGDHFVWEKFFFRFFFVAFLDSESLNSKKKNFRKKSKKSKKRPKKRPDLPKSGKFLNFRNFRPICNKIDIWHDYVS